MQRVDDGTVKSGIKSSGSSSSSSSSKNGGKGGGGGGVWFFEDTVDWRDSAALVKVLAQLQVQAADKDAHLVSTHFFDVTDAPAYFEHFVERAVVRDDAEAASEVATLRRSFNSVSFVSADLLLAVDEEAELAKNDAKIRLATIAANARLQLKKHAKAAASALAASTTVSAADMLLQKQQKKQVRQVPTMFHEILLATLAARTSLAAMDFEPLHAFAVTHDPPYDDDAMARTFASDARVIAFAPVRHTSQLLVEERAAAAAAAAATVSDAASLARM